MKKVSKVSVGYSKGMPKSHCGICEHYLKGGNCTKVEGRIEPEMWCKLFQKKA
jgi:hypothetical protein